MNIIFYKSPQCKTTNDLISQALAIELNKNDGVYVLCKNKDHMKKISESLWGNTDYILPNSTEQEKHTWPIKLITKINTQNDEIALVFNLTDDIVNTTSFTVVEVIGIRDDEKTVSRGKWRQYSAAGIKPIIEEIQYE